MKPAYWKVHWQSLGPAIELNVLSIKHNTKLLISFVVDYIDMLSILRMVVSMRVYAKLSPNVISTGML